jgi:hypothetical protein
MFSIKASENLWTFYVHASNVCRRPVWHCLTNELHCLKITDILEIMAWPLYTYEEFGTYQVKSNRNWLNWYYECAEHVWFQSKRYILLAMNTNHLHRTYDAICGTRTPVSIKLTRTVHYDRNKMFLIKVVVLYSQIKIFRYFSDIYEMPNFHLTNSDVWIHKLTLLSIQTHNINVSFVTRVH